MNVEAPERVTPHRDAELRRLLVSRAARSSVRRRRVTALAAGAASLAVVGALAAVAVVATNTPPSWIQAGSGGEPYEMDVPEFIWADAEVLGAPVVLSSSEDITVPMGLPPGGATDLAILVRCLEPGSYGVVLDRDRRSGSTTWCSADDITGRGGSGSYVSFHADGPNVVTVDVLSADGRFAIWVGWVARPADPEPSADVREAFSDRVVTREEYRAGFDRYVACLADAGVSLIGVDTTDEVIDYSIPSEDVDSGVEHQCYTREFYLLDSEWQVSLEG